MIVVEVLAIWTLVGIVLAPIVGRMLHGNDDVS